VGGRGERGGSEGKRLKGRKGRGEIGLRARVRVGPGGREWERKPQITYIHINTK
jgi:hypothetical protein